MPLTITLIKKSFETFQFKDAFCINETYYTYSYLDGCVAGVQNALYTYATEETIIGVLTDNSIETYASILGIWASGRAFVPLNPKNPKKRNLEILDETGINILLTRDSVFANDLSEERTVICTAGINSENGIDWNWISKSGNAYILFTSGSTGKPKGVQISWENLDAFVESYFDVGFKLDENDRFLQMFDFSFDGSIMSYLPAICVGACSFTISSDNIKYMEVIQVLEEKEITIGLIVPSVLTFLSPYFDEIYLEKFRYCIVGAEASYNSTLTKWMNCIPNAEVYNFYGPTESTVFCLYYHFDPACDSQKSYNGIMCLGHHVKNMKVFICDPDTSEFLAPGLKGEIAISGKQLTKGYINNSAKNKEVFFNSYNEPKEIVYYKTGDEGFFDTEGDFFYCGRIDNQIQIQGFRVELNEIEFPVRENFKIDSLVAIEKKDENFNSEIYLFVENFGGDTKDIMSLLKETIPAYMLPSGIINLPKLPLNANGKIDRNVLKDLVRK